MPPRKIKTQTKKHHFHVTHIPLSSWIVFWLGIAATFVLIFVTFGAAFQAFVVDVSDDTTSQALQQINQNLEKQVGELQATKNTNTTILSEACLQETPSPVDNYLTYVEPQFKVQMHLPFGTNWENEACIFPPAITAGGATKFGPVISRSENTIVRDSILTIQPTKNTADFNAEIEQMKSIGDTQVGTIKQRTINGLKVFSFNTVLPPGYTTNFWYALGKTYSYKIESIGWLTDAEAIKIIQSLRVTK